MLQMLSDFLKELILLYGLNESHPREKNEILGGGKKPEKMKMQNTVCGDHSS